MSAFHIRITALFRLAFLAISLFLCTYLSYGQASYKINRYQEIDGLQSELVKSIAQDPLGFLWVGTDEGLLRFDGLEFKQFKKELPSNYVKSVFCTSKGQLFASTDMGIVEIDYSPDSIQIKVALQGYTKKNEEGAWYPKLFFEDSKSRVWVSDNHTIFQYKNGQFKRYGFDASKVAPNNYHRSFSIFEDGYGHLYAYSETGLLFSYKEGKEAFEEVIQSMPLTVVHHALNIGKGRAVAATNAGVLELTFSEEKGLETQTILTAGSVREPAHFSLASPNELIIGCWSDKPYHVRLDKPWNPLKINDFPVTISHFIWNNLNKDIWVATDNGFMLLQKNLFVPQFTSQSPGYIQHFIESVDGKLYYTDGPKVYEIWEQNGFFESKILYESLHGVVLRIQPTKEGVWLADTEAGLRLLKNDGTQKFYSAAATGGAIYMMDVGEDGSIWFCQDRLNGVGRLLPSGQIKSYGSEAGLSRINTLANINGKMYLGGSTDAGYLFQIEENGQVTNLSQPLTFEHNTDITVFDLAIDNQGVVWAATSFGLLQLKDGKITRANLGVNTNELIKAVTFDKSGAMFIACSKGLIKMKGEGYSFNFDEKDGIPSKIISYRNVHVDSQDRVWICTIAGLAISENPPPQLTPKPIIIGQKINNEKTPNQVSSISLDDFLSFDFVSPTHPNRFINYEYRLISSDTGAWQALGNANTLFLAHLSDQSYQVEMRARQRGNYLWSAPTSYSFQVTRPWHRTWWAWGLLLMAAAGISVVFIRLNSLRLRLEKRKLERLVIARTRELLAKNKEIEAQSEELHQNQEELQTTLENLRHTQAQLVQAEKLSSLGELTAGIAHEINNPINFVFAGSNTLQKLIGDLNEVISLYEQLESSDEHTREGILANLQKIKMNIGYGELKGDINDILKDILVGATRTADIVKNLRNFSRMDDGVFDFANIEEGIDSTLVLLSNKMRKGVKIVKDYSLQSNLRCMPSQINQVFMNIISNAIDAIPEQGEIRVKTIDLGSSIQVRISDTGIGMSEDVKMKIFDPFFTTKKVGEGTGLGMSVVYSIIEKHKGTIEIESAVGEGTTFIITLPKQ